MTERVGLPVYVENDASCAALAEAFRDGRMAVPHLVMFTVGTGVGGGLVLNGRLYRGATGAASEVGHTLIGLDLEHGAPPHTRRVPAGRLARGAGLGPGARPARATRPRARDANSFLGKRLTRDGGVTGHDVVDGAREGDAPSIECLRILGERLGIGIANAITMFDPLEVVIGGGVSAAGELLLGPAREVAWKYAVPGAGTQCEIRLARHGPHAGRARRGAARGAGVRGGDRWRHGGGGGGPMKIACAFDHAGFPLKPLVLEVVAAAGHEPVDLGTNSTDPVDYPDTARAAAERSATVGPIAPSSSAARAPAWRSRRCKFPGIRAACAHDTYTGHQAVEHDDVNMLCLGARVVGPAVAAEVIQAFLAPSSAARSGTCGGWGRSTPSSTSSRRLMADAGDLRQGTCRSPSTGSSATCTRSRWSAPPARSTGTAARRSTRRACSARSWTPRPAASTRCAPRATTGRPSSSTSRTPTSSSRASSRPTAWPRCRTSCRSSRPTPACTGTG